MSGKFAAHVAVLLVCVLAVPVAHGKAIEDYKWIEVRSENFVVRSLLSKRQTTNVVRHLEMMRAVIPKSLLERRPYTPSPGVIYLFKGPSQLNEVGHDGNGWVHNDFRNGEYMLFGADVYAANYVLGYYARYLALAGVWNDQVRWYATGMQYMFRTGRIRDGRFRYGGQRSPQPTNPNIIAPQLDLVLGELDREALSNDRVRDSSRYSWYLVRFLTDSHTDWQAFGDRLERYDELLREGSSMHEAFEGAFSIAVDELAGKLAEFSSSCCAEYVIATEKALPEFDPVVTKLSREQISLGLGKVAVNLEANDRALELLNIALGSDETREEAQRQIEALENPGREQDSEMVAAQ